ncbi:MAG: alpha/beta fold hydrolase [Woeseiaceae bacterium]|nr:alpha/beta fold hydrolase [Woeseiaceae bacterium]
MRWAAPLLFAAQLAVAGAERPAPLAVDELRDLSVDTTIVRERALDPGPGFTAYLVTYQYAGLKLHAMVAVPESDAPEDGYPVVIANHGYVPDPRRYGITVDGRDSRPGDYYRSVPGLFASRGFLTVIPDYRGHSSSEGFDDINPQTDESFAYYAEDVVALIAVLDQLDNADLDNVFMWSHSMGGIVAARALLATDVVQASSFWSTMDVTGLSNRFDAFDGPVNVHHAAGDEATPVTNSRSLAEALEDAGLLAGYFEYEVADHFFDEQRRESAADLDAQLFRSRLR